jgi:hypothetical protein
MNQDKTPSIHVTSISSDIYICGILGLVYGLIKSGYDPVKVSFWVFIAHIIALCIVIFLMIFVKFMYTVEQRKQMLEEDSIFGRFMKRLHSSPN